jgi:hypothetical protein
LAHDPSARLARVQLPGRCELLLADHERFKPARVLFLTGANWLAPFVFAVGSRLRVVDRDGLQAVGTWGASRVVVAAHPQGKPERALVDAIAGVFVGADGPPGDAPP